MNFDFLLAPDSEEKIDLYKDKKTNIFLGFVKLIDVMPRIVPKGRTGDIALVQGARVSYGSTDLKSEKADKGLVEYLVEHYHTSPLEMAEVKFIIRAPLFVVNQLVRHRTANLNILSFRYTEVRKDMFFIPEIRVQDTINHQGSKKAKVDKEVEEKYDSMFEYSKNTFELYKECVDNGVGKEVARGAMPQNVMTDAVWKCDLHNFLKMCRLRVHSTAQKEIQDLANAMYSLVKPKFPIACAAYEKYWLNCVSFSQEEIEMLKSIITKKEFKKFESKRKRDSFQEKLDKLDLINPQ